MSKSLGDKDNKQDAAVQDRSGASPPDYAKAYVGAYAQQGKPDISQKAWDEAGALNASPGGRFAIRVFSRGVMGSAFFAVGGILAQKWLGKNGAANRYNSELPWRQQNNPAKFMAKLTDTIVAHPLKAVVKTGARLIGKDAATAERIGAEAIHFRPTAWEGLPVTKAHSLHLPGVNGRTFGHETVSVTFDFFCASVGDALGRDIVNTIDPHLRKSSDPKVRPKWINEKGYVKPWEAVKSGIKAIIRYATFNGGEDWVVGMTFYPLFMKLQSAVIDRHISPGFKYDSHRVLNAGSVKMGGNPRLSNGALNPDHKVVGHYTMEGMLDLQGRFVVYNIGTLMFREAYDHITHKLAHEKTSLYGSPAREETKGVFNKTADLLKWMVRSTVKGTIYMTPIMPFFWLNRTAQFKHDGYLIHPEHGVLSRNGHPVRVNEFNPDPSTLSHSGDCYYYTKDPINQRWGGMDPVVVVKDGIKTLYPHPSIAFPAPMGGKYNAFKAPGGPVTQALNGLSLVNDRVANSLNERANELDRILHAKKVKHALRAVGINKIKEFTHPFLRSAMAYGPYMWAKAEAANYWDNGKMDMSIERTIDGAAHLKWGEFKAGIGEIGHSLLRRPLSDPAREEEAKRRLLLDDTPPEDFDQAQHERDREIAKKTWGQRVLTNRQPQQETEFNNNDVAGRIGFGKKPRTADGKPVRSYAEQEALRQVLEESNPPTNALH